MIIGGSLILYFFAEAEGARESRALFCFCEICCKSGFENLTFGADLALSYRGGGGEKSSL